MSRRRSFTGGIGDRHDELQDHDGQTLGMPVPAEGPDELDDDARDEQQPEDEQRETENFEEQRQLSRPHYAKVV